MLFTVKDACRLNEGALSIRISDGIERITEETLDPAAGRLFLQQSYLTKGMLELVKESFRRLSGSEGGRPVFRLKQAMGGGKTHLIKTMAFLARHPELRPEFFPESHAKFPFAEAGISFFNGREQPDGFFWGHIAADLGHEGFFESGVKSPGENHWHALFDKIDAPVLILLDEMPTYFGYYLTQTSGNGTVADVAGRAFANLLSAAIGRKNVCVIVSDLEASHTDGSRIINTALDNARRELSRVEVNITPVDLAGDETYAILKKRLFAELPDENKINFIAESFAKSIEVAQKSKTIDQQKTPEQLAKEVAESYPFHPQMKHLFALFKENKEFQQTRGLMELASRMLASVWNRGSNDVLLIGPQHFDLAIEEVRDKVLSISKLDEAVAKDVYSDDGSAHAQVIDANTGNDAATQVANLLLISSMSTAVNPVKGLTQSEALECLAAPNVDLSFYQEAVANLLKSSWYLHKSGEGRIYFDKLENLTKMLTGLASKAPEPKVQELVSKRLTEMYAPKSKRVYGKVLALPNIDDIQADVQSGRVLAIVSPDSKMPPEEVTKLFTALVRKNNLLLLTGEKSFEMPRLWDAARQVYAVEQAEAQRRIEKGGPQWEEFEDLRNTYAQQFNGVVKSIFDKVLFPFQRPGQEPTLMPRPLEQSGDTNDGEARIEATLTKDPIKLYLDWVDPTKFSGVRSRIERLFACDDAAWADIKDRAQTDCSMYFLAPGDLDRIKARAIAEGKWEELGNGWVTKNPKPKQATVQVSIISAMNDQGETIIQVTALNSNPDTTSIYYAEDSEVSEVSKKLDDDKLTTKAIQVAFLAVDNSGKAIKGQPYIWKNKLKVQFNVGQTIGGEREISINVLPRADIVRYTLNGAEPRDGIEYKGPFKVNGQACPLLIYAECDGREEKAEYKIHAAQPDGASGDGGVAGRPYVDPEPPETKPVLFPITRLIDINAREKVFAALSKAKERGVSFGDLTITFSDGQSEGRVQLSGVVRSAESVLSIINSIGDGFPSNVPLTMKFREAFFGTGQDLKDFTKEIGLNYIGEWREQ